MIKGLPELCIECIRDKNWSRITFTGKHNKDCKQYSNYDDMLEKQRKYAATVSQMDQCLYHSSESCLAEQSHFILLI